MKLVEVNPYDAQHLVLLYDLLEQREEFQNISHREMPSWDQHCHFVASRPYFNWYLIQTEAGYVGTVYLTRDSEIGIHLLESCQGRGWGTQAIEELMRLNPRDCYYANIAPRNIPSQEFFGKLGFHALQVTYVLEKSRHG